MHGVHGSILQEIDGELHCTGQAQSVCGMGKQVKINPRRNGPVRLSQSHRTERQWRIQCRPHDRDPIAMRMKAGPGDELEMQVPRAPFLQVRAQPGTGKTVCAQALALSGRTGQRRPEVDHAVVLKIGAYPRQVQHGFDPEAFEIIARPYTRMQKQERRADGAGRKNDFTALDPPCIHSELDRGCRIPLDHDAADRRAGHDGEIAPPADRRSQIAACS
jgi:hypothetical protein